MTTSWRGMGLVFGTMAAGYFIRTNSPYLTLLFGVSVGLALLMFSLRTTWFGSTAPSAALMWFFALYIAGTFALDMYLDGFDGAFDRSQFRFFAAPVIVILAIGNNLFRKRAV